MEPIKRDEYEFSEEDLKKIEKLAQLTEKELEEINKEVENETKHAKLDLFSHKNEFNPDEYRKNLIKQRKEEKMAHTRKRYWLDVINGRNSKLDLFDIEIVSKYMNRESLLTMLIVSKKVTNVKDRMVVNKFEFKKAKDFETFKGIKDYHTQANEESIRLLKEMIEGKDIPKPEQIIIEMKEDGEVPILPDVVDLINREMDCDSRTKLINMINYDVSKFAITLKDLDIGSESEPEQWYSKKAMILIPSIDMAYSNLSTIDLHLCTNLTELKDALMKYEGWPQMRGCFEFYDNLTEIILPSSIEKLGKSTFHGCKNLVSIKLPERVNYLGNYCFSSCSSLSSIDLPSNITYIGSSCFSGCFNLNRIKIPSQITKLKKFTFAQCVLMTQVILPTRIKELGKSCFEDCVTLNNIIIPDSVTRIKTRCFFNCESLNNLIIPDNVELGRNAVPNQREIEEARGIQRNTMDSIDDIIAGSPPNENGGFGGFGARKEDN